MLVLDACSLSKVFRVRTRGPRTLLEAVRARFFGRSPTVREVRALRDVSFSLDEGRTLGIVGHNGAGKSTLLRVLCGATTPTSGHLTASGNVHGLLELGGGFKHELTGRQNLMTAGLLNGLTAAEVRAREDAVIAFAELEHVIDYPVRTYSTGMFLRLAFSAAVHFDPAILVIDEVLSVGDAHFQQRCVARIEEFRKAGGTLVFASHVPEQIRAMCDEVLVLNEGRVEMIAEPDEALKRHDDLMAERTRRRAEAIGAPIPATDGIPPGGARHGTQEGSIDQVHLMDRSGSPVGVLRPGDDLDVLLELRLPCAGADFAISVGVFSAAHAKCFEALLPSGPAVFGRLPARARVRCTLPALHLLPGVYSIVVGLYPPGIDHSWDYHWHTHRIRVEADIVRPDVSGVVNVIPRWDTERADGERPS